MGLLVFSSELGLGNHDFSFDVSLRVGLRDILGDKRSKIYGLEKASREILCVRLSMTYTRTRMKGELAVSQVLFPLLVLDVAGTVVTSPVGLEW